MFGQLGTLARERPKERGVFKDQMPYRVKFFKDNDAQVQYEDACTAMSAIDFFNGEELKGNKIKVQMARLVPLASPFRH